MARVATMPSGMVEAVAPSDKRMPNSCVRRASARCRRLAQSSGSEMNPSLTDHIYIDKYRYRVMPKKNPDAFLPLRSNWFHILLCLVEGEQHGYGIMQNVLARSDGKVRLWPATLYGSLRRLIEAGLIVESGDRPAPEFDDARRRYYKLTTLGRRVLDLESQRLKDLVRVLDARRRQEART